jgi:hypothetical protein
VISDDTDVFVLLAHFYQQFQLSASLVMEPTSPEKTSVNIGDTVRNHHFIIPQPLAAHALTGCDTVGCYFGIGKVKVVKVLQAENKLDSIGQPELSFEMQPSSLQHAMEKRLVQMTTCQTSDTGSGSPKWVEKLLHQFPSLGLFHLQQKHLLRT